MEYLTAMEISKLWNISSRMVAYYCETGRIAGAVKKGKTWFIPSRAGKPADKRRSRKKVKPAEDNIMQTEPVTEMETADTDAVYHIRDVSHHLGFTRETLRYYEEIGLISPKREKYSQYREFDFYDISHLMAIDFYRKRGFTPIQIKNLLGAGSRQEYEEILEEQRDTLKNEIEHLQEMLRRFETARDFYDYSTANIGRFEVRTMPAYYVRESIDSILSVQEYRGKVLTYLNLDSEDILSKMVRSITFDETGYKGAGMFIVMQNPSDKNETYLLEGGRCLYTTLIAENNDNTLLEKMFVLCHQWAKEHQETFRGIVHIFIRFVKLEEHTDENYYEVWMPLK